ncbi:MAG: GNAT family N-acetyltransferase, partial [Cyanobacteria bacterium P01_D01_bin.73]
VRQPGLLGMDQDEADRLVTFPGSGVVTIKPTTKKALTIPIAAPDQEPERAIASNLSTATTFDISQIRFQKVFHLNPKNLEEYDDLTFPRLKKRWKNYQQQGEIFGISASFSESIIGLAIAEVMPDNIANLISLFVQTPYRNKGIGTRLLTYSMKESRQQECEAIQLNYHATESTLALERILEKLRCQKPKTQFFLGRATIANFVENPSKGRVHLPPESQVFPWTGLTKAEGETIKSIGESGAYPSEVCPFGNDPRLESTTSLGIRYNESVVGWLVTHRVSEDTIRYTHWWTLEPYRSQGWSIALLAAALDRQIAANIPYATFAVSAKEKPMVRFFQRRMMPYLDYTSESKTLLQPLK